ncbi:MAG TPA: hypothetical protein VHT23_04500 [Gemmatimonadaceae bacterium]|nr:hypothetical protein [Gemmatimonadaceae bacterium]
MLSILAMAQVAMAQMPRLFEPLAKPSSRVTANAVRQLPKGVDYMLPVRMHEDMLGSYAFDVAIEGVTRTAIFVKAATDRSSSLPAGTSYFYDTGEVEQAVFTTFSAKPGEAESRYFFGHVQVGGKSYFITKADDGQYLVTHSTYSEPLNEVVHEATTLQSALNVAADAIVTQGVKRRAARSGAYYPIPLAVAIDDTFLTAIGSKEKAEARTAHYFDRAVAALRNSGAGDIVPYVKGIGYGFQVPDPKHPFDWAVAPGSPTIALRQANETAGVVLLMRDGQFEAIQTSGEPTFFWPDRNMIIAGGYTDDVGEVDVQTFIHEIGHFLGGRHDRAHAVVTLVNGVDPYPFAYDWLRCDMGLFGALAYADCGHAIDVVELYSGLHSMYNGQSTGIADQQDNVRMFHLVAPIAAHSFDANGKAKN